MFWFVSKKELAKERAKIKASFKRRDKRLDKLRDKIDTNSLKIATLEGALSVISNKSQVSLSQSPKRSQHTFETKLINKIRKTKRVVVMDEMLKLVSSHSGIDMFNIIVLERGLCSKASFYRYLTSLKSQRLMETETSMRQPDLTK